MVSVFVPTRLRFAFASLFSAAVLAFACQPRTAAAQSASYEYKRTDHIKDSPSHASLTRGRDGNLYGYISPNDHRTERDRIIRVTAAGEVEVIYALTRADGVVIHGKLLAAADGNLYGSTAWGGVNGTGTVFRIEPTTGAFTKLADFPADFLQSSRLETIGPDGELYGLCSREAGNESGLIFRCTRLGEISVLARFYGLSLENGNISILGLDSPTTLITGADGFLYGTTARGGTSYPVEYFAGTFPTTFGAVFRCTLDGKLSVLSSFEPASGVAPATIAQGIDGALYGLVEHTEWTGTENTSQTQLWRFPLSGGKQLLHTFNVRQEPGWVVDPGVYVSADGRMFAVRRIGISQGSRLFEFSTTGYQGDLLAFESNLGRPIPGGMVLDEENRFRGISTEFQSGTTLFQVRGDFGQPLPLPPLARDDSFRQPSLPEELPVLRNDSGNVTIVAVTQPEAGSVVVAEDGKSVLFAPGGENPVAQHFSYTVERNGVTATALVYLRTSRLAGSFAGTLPLADGSGYLRLQFSNSGTFSGRLAVRGRELVLRGTLAPDGTYTLDTKIPILGNDFSAQTLPVNLKFTAAAEGADLAGAIQVGEELSEFTLPRLTLPDQGFVGTYNAVLPAGESHPSPLQGTGWARITVSEGGRIRAVGKLSDRRSLALSGDMIGSKAGVVFRTMYRDLRSYPPMPSGFIGGSLAFSKNEGNARVTGAWNWRRANYSKKNSAFSMHLDQQVEGEFWSPGYNFAGRLQRRGAEATLRTPIINEKTPLVITQESISADAWALSGSYSGRTGVVVGSVQVPGTNKETVFSGVILPFQRRASALFFHPDGSGTLEIAERSAVSTAP